MRLVYLGSPAAAVPPLRALAAAGHDIALVVSRADKRRGRGAALQPSAVKAAAVELGLAVTDGIDDILGLDPPADLGVVVAYGRLIKPHLLDVLPFINIHFSLLPRWRGAAPVERALLAGDSETGVCLMALEAGLDTGPVYRRRSTSIRPEESLAEVRDRLVELGTEMLVDALREGLGTAIPQEGEPTYAAKIDPAEHELRWELPAETLARIVRLGQAWTTFRGRRLKVLDAGIEGVAEVDVPGTPVLPDGADRAPATLHDTVTDPGARRQRLPGTIDGLRVATGHGALVLRVVQPEGKPAMPARDWRNGAQPRPEERLGRAPEPA